MRRASEGVVFYPSKTLTSPSCSWFIRFVFSLWKKKLDWDAVHSRSTVGYSQFPGAFIDLQNDHISALKIIHY